VSISLHVIFAAVAVLFVVALIAIGVVKNRRRGLLPSNACDQSIGLQFNADVSGEYSDGVVGKPRIVGENQSAATSTQSPAVTDVADYVNNGFITLYVMAKPNQQFAGYELMQALLAANLAYGEMEIFHRYDEINPKAPVFSVASATKPGTIDFDGIGSYSCTGLCLFMKIKNTNSPARALSSMLEAADRLAEDLNGVIEDQYHQPVTNMTLEALFKAIELQSAEQIEMAY